MKRTLGIIMALAMFTGTSLAAQAPDPKKVEEGKKLYTTEKCEKCHNIAGKGASKGKLDGVGKKLAATEIRKWFTNTEDMESKLEKPPTGTNRMSNALKTKKLTDSEVDALVAYVSTLVK
jgi:mono/diheme cytochrome c family protein